MESNKINKATKYSLNNSAKPIIQIQNFFRVDHHNKLHQNQNKINNKNNGTHQYELYYSSRSKSKERESDTSYITKPKIILNNLPPEFNITANNINEENIFTINKNITKNNYGNNNNSKEKLINNFLIGAKKEKKLKDLSSNKTNSLTNIHVANNNKLNFTSNELVQNNKNLVINNVYKKNSANHFRTEGSEFETQENTNTKNTGITNNFTSTGFKPFNIYNITNAGKTYLKYDKIDYNNNTNLSEIEEIVPKKKDKNTKSKFNGKHNDKKESLIDISGIGKKNKNFSKNINGIKPIKINNYNNNYQRKVIPPIMNKIDNINFDNESLFSVKNTQMSNINNINYSKFQKVSSNSNLNLLEQPGKTYTHFQNDLNFNNNEERKSLPVKNINNNVTKKAEKPKIMSRPSSEDKNTESNNNMNFNEKFKIKKKIEEIISTKSIPNNLNEGIFYKYQNGYKYYFDMINIDCYLLKEIPGNIKNIIDDWNKNYRKYRNYLKIFGYKKYENQMNYTVVIEYPTGGENFSDIINLIGFYDVKFLLNISQIIYESLSLIKNDNNNRNIPFCLCDIYLNINNHIKIIPPFIRNIHFNGKIELCKCKKLINKIINLFKYGKNCFSFICFGISLLQLISQNLLFKMNSIIYLMYKSNQLKLFKKCCLLHTILNIESNLFKDKKYLLLSDFISLYPQCVSDFIHICTKFNFCNDYNIIYKHEFLNMYDANNNIEVYTKELLNIVTFDSKYNQNIIPYELFLKKFEKLYKKLEINSYIFCKVFRHKKIINNLIRAFNIIKNNELDKLLNFIEPKNTNLKNLLK